MISTFGYQITWPKFAAHWEMRKGFTIPHYYSKEFGLIQEQLIEYSQSLSLQEKKPQDFLASLDEFAHRIYTYSCINCLQDRIVSYEAGFLHLTTGEHQKFSGSR